MHLTDITVRNLAIPLKGQKTYFDDALSGFGVRVSQTGRKSFVVMYGKARQLKTLGKYPDKTLKSAREEAKTFLAAIPRYVHYHCLRSAEGFSFSLQSQKQSWYCQRVHTFVESTPS